MIIPVFKARQLARAYLQDRGDIDMSMVWLHYLGVYKRRQAFELRFHYPDDWVVDKGLPIVLLVSAKAVEYIQSGVSLDIIYMFWEKGEKRREKVKLQRKREREKERQRMKEAEPQLMADKCARKNGYFCASLLGTFGDALAFSPRYKVAEALPDPDGLPAIILVQDAEAMFIHDGETFKVLEKINYREYERGRTIFQEYERRVKDDDFKSKKEKDYITEIVYHRWPNYDVPVDEETLYDYLEIADRLGMKLKFRPNVVCEKRTDGWMYDIVLKKKS